MKSELFVREVIDRQRERVTLSSEPTFSTMKELFEEIYLGPPCTVELVLPSDVLAQVNKAFDQIIRQHGIKPVQFEFVVKCP